MTGINEVCKGINAKCPYCRRALDMSNFGSEFFRRILRALARGERVEAENFGTFRAPVVPGRKVVGLDKKIRWTSDKRVIRFRASNKAKRVLNAEANIESKHGGDDE